jgi:hypothetical protein
VISALKAPERGKNMDHSGLRDRLVIGNAPIQSVSRFAAESAPQHNLQTWYSQLKVMMANEQTRERMNVCGIIAPERGENMDHG